MGRIIDLFLEGMIWISIYYARFNLIVSIHRGRHISEKKWARQRYFLSLYDQCHWIGLDPSRPKRNA